MVILKKFNELTRKELWEIARLRIDVFTLEQKIDENDLDDEDYKALHIYIKDKDKIVSYARILKDDDFIKVGRVCTNINYRNLGLQTKIFKYIIKKYEKIYVSSQDQVVSFYEKLGFKKVGDKYLEANILHQKLTFTK